MAFSISAVAAKDGNGTAIAGGVDFVDTSGTGAGPWIITKVTIDPAGVNVQGVLSNSAAKTDLSSVAGTTTAVGHGVAATALRVELPTDGTGLVNAAQSGTWTARVVGNAGGIIDAATGAAVPANALYAGMNVGGNLTGLTGSANGLKVDGSAVTQPVSGTFFQATQPVSGTVTANQGGAPWTANVTQFGGTNVSTGTGVGGAGIPRVTISNDSSLAANQSVNLAQVGGSNVGFTNPLFVQEPDAAGAAAATGTGNNSVTSATVVFSVDTTGYSAIAIQVTSAGTTCTTNYEGSNDNSTWLAVTGYTTNPSGTGSQLINNTTTTAGGSIFPCNLRYFRARVSTYTSGTVTIFYALRKNYQLSVYQAVAATNGMGTQNIAQSGAWNVGLSASATGGYSYNHISTDTTTTVKSGAGTLHSIVINTLAATGTATVFDNTVGSGTTIAVITAGAIGTLIYDLAFATGLTIVTATAAPDITVTYK